MPRTFTTDDRQVVQASEAQHWLWDCWKAYWADVERIADGRPIIVVVNGDMVEGAIKYQTTQLVTNRLDDHEDIAVSCAEVFTRLTDSIYIVRGTPAHVTAGAQMEERIAYRLKAVPVDDRFSNYELWLVVEDVRLHFAHHRGGSHRPWTRGNPMRVQVLKMLYYCIEYGLDAPHVIIRSHMHTFEDTHEQVSRICRGLALGAWQLKTEFVHRIEQAGLSEIGGFIIECDSGAAVVHKREFLPTGRARPAYTTWMKKH